MIWINFAISEQKVNLKNHFCVLKKSKSFECIFRIQKSIEIASILKERVDTRSLLLEKLRELNRKCCGHDTFKKIQTMSARADISALILKMYLNGEMLFRLRIGSCGDYAPYSPHLLRRIIALWRPEPNT